MADYKLAASGEVFYIEKGELQVAPSLAIYQAMLERQELLRNTVVKFELRGTHYTVPVVEHRRVVSLALQLPANKMTRVLSELQTKLEMLGL